MTCPFLREAQVKYCQTAAVRTMIPLAQAASTQEKCSAPTHVTCPIYQDQPKPACATGACPHLRESLMQYCAAASVTKFVPYSEALLSRCGNESYRYCELYLGMAHPGVEAESAGEIPMPGWLHYAPNHMWLDVSGDGLCHAGIDAFLARVLGKVETVTYVRLKGRQRPAAVLSTSGIDFEMTFPNVLQLTSCNLYLRANPSRITAEPYTGGWLFEGTPEEGITAHLRSGAAAREWMQGEQRRLNEYLQQLAGVAADGGSFAPNLAALLDRGQMVALFHEFFSPYASA
jgi:glycine cleavage system H lipoate-binding protein